MTTTSGVSASQVYDFLMQSQFWSQTQMKAYQRQQLASLLRHAKTNVPFYRTRLDPLFKSDGSIDWENWQHISILKRADVALHFDALQAVKLPEGHGPVGEESTSGSTGLPIRIRHPFIIGAVGVAHDWRAHRWWNLDWSAAFVSWHGDLPDNWEQTSRTSIGPWGNSEAAHGTSYNFMRQSPLEKRIQHLQDVGAKYLYAQGNLPYAAALDMQRVGLKSKLDATISYGVNIEPEFHEAVAKSFGAIIRGMYSSKEAARIGFTCSTGMHYHVCSESVLVEILDDDNLPCEVGQPGRVIVSPFLNTSQPFIRYEQGDVASWGPPCSCGISLPVIQKIDGRVYHLFRKPNGLTFAPTVLDHYRSELGAEFWQFAQTKQNEVTVRYKPEGLRKLECETAFARMLQKILEHNYDVVYELVDDMPRTTAGKFIKYTNELP